MALIRLNQRNRQLVDLIRANRLKFFYAMVCMLAMGITTAASAYLIKPVIDDIFVNKDLQMLKLIPLLVVAIYFLRGLGTYGQEYFLNFIGQDIIRQLRNQLYNKIQDLPLQFFHTQKTGTLMSRITNDVNIIRAMVSHVVTGALRDCFTIICLVAVVVYRDWLLAIFALIILPAAFVPISKIGRRVRRVSTSCQEAMADLNVFLHETFVGTKIVKAFGMQAYEKKRFDEKTRQIFDLEIKAVRSKAIASPVMEFLAGLGIAFVIGYGGYRVIMGTSTAGTFFSFMAAVIMLYEPVKRLSKINNTVQEGLAAANRVYDILEAQNPITDAVQPVIVAAGPHRVNFEQVDFKYEDTLVLKDINLEACCGEVIALVGMSGGGKTTLVNLIPRFYDVSSGSVRIDGVDVRDMIVTQLRDQIAIVTQEPILFNESIRNNIAYGRPDASQADIERVAEAAYALDFIRALPTGFDTSIGELGGRLSGGEKQRLCIARALLKDAPILILDEATSSLDSEAESLVQKALENLMQGRTTFMIAHRLSTISHADRIVVLADGRIAEIGDHDALMHQRSAYYKLHQLQFTNNNNDGDDSGR